MWNFSETVLWLQDTYKASKVDAEEDDGELCQAENSLLCAERDGKFCVDRTGSLWQILLQVGSLTPLLMPKIFILADE